jgi:DNA mismatch repair protein MLH1
MIANIASVSFVGKLTITSRTKDQDVAYKAYFEDGKLVPGSGTTDETPQACAGYVGTIIEVKDMFYNVKQRRKGFSKKEEYMKIIEVVMNYATHFCNLNFICKELHSNNTAVSTININRKNRSENDIRKELI